MSLVPFGATMLASSMMNNLFTTYYIELYTTIARVPPAWFYLGQVVFALWNAVNDPLFGWLSDKGVMAGSLRRTDTILWGGGCWVAAFLFTWWPWMDDPEMDGWWSWSGLHFVLALCAYDGFLTLVELNHSALLAEIVHTEGDRASANMWSAVFAAVGSLSSWAAHVWWDAADLVLFRRVCFVVAGLSMLAFFWSVRGTRLLEPPPSPSKKTISTQTSGNTYRAFLSQLVSHANFRTFSGISILQVFDCTFEKHFFAPFLDALAGATLPAWVRGAVVSASFLVPHIGTMVLTPWIRSHGLYRVLRGIFRLRLTLLTSAVLASFGSWYFGGGLLPSAILVAVFMLANRVTSESVCRLTPLVLADLVDEDRALHRRPHSLAASIVGSAAFASKFSQSAAPVVALFILGYATPTHTDGASALQSALEQGRQSNTNPSPLAQVIWGLLLLIPLFIVIIQAYLWTRYTLYGRKLSQVQATIRDLDTGLDQETPQSTSSDTDQKIFPQARKRSAKAPRLVLDVPPQLI